MFKSKFPALLSDKEERDQRTYKQYEIAKAVDLRQPTISTWLNYDRRFSRVESNIVGPLADWLDCDPCDLFEFASD